MCREVKQVGKYCYKQHSEHNCVKISHLERNCIINQHLKHICVINASITFNKIIYILFSLTIYIKDLKERGALTLSLSIFYVIYEFKTIGCDSFFIAMFN